jgi:hypothetical protein
MTLFKTRKEICMNKYIDIMKEIKKRNFSQENKSQTTRHKKKKDIK